MKKFFMRYREGFDDETDSFETVEALEKAVARIKDLEAKDECEAHIYSIVEGVDVTKRFTHPEEFKCKCSGFFIPIDCPTHGRSK